MTVQKTEPQKADGLSEKAQAYLDTLKEKFGNVNFVVVKDADAAGKHPGGGKELTCIISMDLLERMAADEEVAAKYEGIITNAIKDVDELKAQVEARGLGHLVKGFSIRVFDDGTTVFQAMLKEGTRDLHGKKVDENHKGAWHNSKEEVLGYLEKLKHQQTKHPHGKGAFQPLHIIQNVRIITFFQPVQLFSIRPLLLSHPHMMHKPNQAKPGHGHNHAQKCPCYSGAKLNVNKIYSAKHLKKIMHNLRQPSAPTHHGHHTQHAHHSHHASRHAKITRGPMGPVNSGKPHAASPRGFMIPREQIRDINERPAPVKAHRNHMKDVSKPGEILA
jgi:hypothetical protein